MSVSTVTPGGLDPKKAPVLFAIVAPFRWFFRLEAAGGLIMIASAILALVWANSELRWLYEEIFHATIEMKIAGRGLHWSIHHFVNDALMTLFFVVAGLEIKRELTQGELSSWRQASLPLIAAVGGMVVPALIYLAFNPSGPARAGWEVPVATDIAFALGCLSLVRRRVPATAFIFLTALAIFDDLGAILVIAFFYGGEIHVTSLLLAMILTAILVLLGRARVQMLWPYGLVGLLLWIVILQSGVHATLAGVIIGLCLPTGSRRPAGEVLEELDEAITSLRREIATSGKTPDGTIVAIERHLESVQSPLDRALHRLHGVVAFGIVPLFALANAGVAMGLETDFLSPVTLGAMLGLVVGKPVGVYGALLLATRLRLAPRPNATASQILGVAIMAGIGFTMSLFIGSLGLGADRAIEDQAKLGVLVASAVSAIVGIVFLRVTNPLRAESEPADLPVVLDVPRYARGYGVRVCHVPDVLKGRTIRELDVRRRFGVTLIGIWRRAEESRARLLETVDPERPLQAGDVLLVAGEEKQFDPFLDYVKGGGESADRAP